MDKDMKRSDIEKRMAEIDEMPISDELKSQMKELLIATIRDLRKPEISEPKKKLAAWVSGFELDAKTRLAMIVAAARVLSSDVVTLSDQFLEPIQDYTDDEDAYSPLRVMAMMLQNNRGKVIDRVNSAQGKISQIMNEILSDLPEFKDRLKPLTKGKKSLPVHVQEEEEEDDVSDVPGLHVQNLEEDIDLEEEQIERKSRIIPRI